ncbi:hypothetical protein J1605_013746 [Eschrichtius robustus]|uniref:Uncharacterized protein n=1 Tax=Eschrichtius robustus TaxID=9764 RepID=A0AB34GH24_ESCRO|nr:hypothetical protein J1605_013746 [Eschrichtius robustus]
METTVGLSLASATLKIAILGWIMYLRWKRSKGLQTKARTPASKAASPEQSTSVSTQGQGYTANDPSTPSRRPPSESLKPLPSSSECVRAGHRAPTKRTSPMQSQLHTGISVPHNHPGQTQTTQKPAGVEGHQGPERHIATCSSSLFNFLALDHKNKSPCTICLNASKEKADITFNFCPSCHK